MILNINLFIFWICTLLKFYISYLHSSDFILQLLHNSSLGMNKDQPYLIIIVYLTFFLLSVIPGKITLYSSEERFTPIWLANIHVDREDHLNLLLIQCKSTSCHTQIFLHVGP